MSCKNYLIRSNGSLPNVVVFIGNGIFKNGWDIVKKAAENFPYDGEFNRLPVEINTLYNYQLYSFNMRNLCDKLSPSFLAMMSYNERSAIEKSLRESWRLIHQISKGKREEFSFDTYQRELEKLGIERTLITFANFRNRLWSSIQKTELEPRKNVHDLFSKLMDVYPSIGFVTLNWDNFLWNLDDDKLENLIYLHGRAFNESQFECSQRTLILPTETSDEFCNHMHFSKAVEEFVHLLKNTWGEVRALTDEERKFLDQIPIELSMFTRHTSMNRNPEKCAPYLLKSAHNLAFDWVDHAKDLVIWGCGCNDYDHEFNLLLSQSASQNGSLENVYIVNPDSDGTVCSKVKFLVSGNGANITRYDSCDFLDFLQRN